MSAERPAPVDPEHLLAEDPFVRGLARHLLRDPDAADDLAQQTWLAALQRGPRGIPLRHWLVAVMRRLCARDRRAQQRELARQRAAALREPVPSTDAIVAREALRAEVVAAVLALDEPHRDVVLLRFFEHLPPRAIARRLSLPVETVRTRLKRALARLRLRLDGRHGGDRAAWCALLLPSAHVPAGPVAAAAAGLHALSAGVLAMTTKAKLAAAVSAFAGVLLLTLWALTGAPPVQAPTTARTGGVEAAVAAPPATTGTTQAAAAPAPQPAAERQQVAADAPTTGALVVHAFWKDDHSPAADLEIEAWRNDGDELFDHPRARTDRTGTVRFPALPPGRTWPVVNRGEGIWGDEAKVAAGAVTEATFAIEVGMNAKGRVVDGSQQPVAGAEVLVSGWAGGEALPLARTAADGTFALRGLATHCHVGARADGYAASPMRQFTASKGALVEFTIVLDHPGASLAGTVLGPRGDPVAGAIVQAGTESGKMEHAADGTITKAAMPARATTDAAGRFAFHSLAGGRTPLAVRAPGLARWRDDVDVQAGRDNVIAVHLDAGVTLDGTVRDAAGAPVAKAEIRVGDWEDLGHRRTRSDAAGAFHLEGLPTGELDVHVDAEKRGKTSGKVQGTAGAHVRFDAVLHAGLTLHGRVLDPDDKPVAHAMVEARCEGGARGEPWWAVENTDADGRFALADCAPGVSMRIEVKRGMFPEAVMKQVPTADELVIHVPKQAHVFITGTVVDPDGKPVANAHVSPYMKGANGSPALTTDAATGAFRCGPYPAGAFQLTLQVDGFPRIVLPARADDAGESFQALAGDDVWDLGAIRLQRGGTLTVALITAGADEPRTLALFDDQERRIDEVEVKGGTGTTRPLQPGHYRLSVHGQDLACAMVPFDVRAGQDTRLDVRAEPGTETVIACAVPPEDERERAVHVVVRTPAGELVFAGDAWEKEGPMTLRLSLQQGDYRVEASLGALRATADLTVRSGTPARTDLALRKR